MSVGGCIDACVRERARACATFSSDYTISQERMVSVSLSSVSMETLSSFLCGNRRRRGALDVFGVV